MNSLTMATKTFFKSCEIMTSTNIYFNFSKNFETYPVAKNMSCLLSLVPTSVSMNTKLTDSFGNVSAGPSTAQPSG